MIWPRLSEAKPVLPALKLEGFRVILRPPKLKDWTDWAEIRDKNRDILEPLEPAWPENCLSLDFFKRRLARQVRDWQSDRGYSFLVFTKENSSLIGGVNINHVCRGAAQYASLGYWLDRDAQGVGYMAEALRLVIDYGFNELELHRFHAGCLQDNKRSINLLLKLGFVEEGMAEKYVQINGKWQDHRLFGLPVERWS